MLNPNRCKVPPTLPSGWVWPDYHPSTGLTAAVGVAARHATPIAATIKSVGRRSVVHDLPETG